MIVVEGHVVVYEQRQDVHDHFVQSHKQASTPAQVFGSAFKFMVEVNVKESKKAL